MLMITYVKLLYFKKSLKFFNFFVFKALALVEVKKEDLIDPKFNSNAHSKRCTVL
jgi:hypothetical protein